MAGDKGSTRTEMKGDKRNNRPRCEKHCSKEHGYFLPVPLDSRGVLLILDFHVAIRLDFALLPCPVFPLHRGTKLIEQMYCNKVLYPATKGISTK